MNPKTQQIEFEVFPKDYKLNHSYVSAAKADTNPRGASIQVIFSNQSVLIIFICAVASLVASFSLGVEKGKLIAKNSLNVPPAAGSALEVATSPKEIPAAPIASPVAPAPQAPVVPAAVAEKMESAPASSNYAIQVASVKSRDSAKTLCESLIKKGFSSFLKPSGTYIVVLAGNFLKKEEARPTLKELQKTFKDCFIRKI